MAFNFLILYGRAGCCLCEGLEKRLREISLHDLVPSMNLRVVDIDSDNFSEIERARYDLRVPVLLIELKNHKQLLELPVVSPRIKEKQLFDWIQKEINQLIQEC